MEAVVPGWISRPHTLGRRRAGEWSMYPSRIVLRSVELFRVGSSRRSPKRPEVLRSAVFRLEIV